MDPFSATEDELVAFINARTPGSFLEGAGLGKEDLQGIALSLLDAEITGAENEGASASKDLSKAGEAVSDGGAAADTGAKSEMPSVADSDDDDVDEWQNELIKEFMEISNCDRQVAKQLLEAFSFDMDSAAVMYMEQEAEKAKALEERANLPIAPPLSIDGGRMNAMNANIGRGGIDFPPLPGPSDYNEFDEDTGDSSIAEYDEDGIRRPDPTRRAQRLNFGGSSPRNDYDDPTARAEAEDVDWMFPPPLHLSFPGSLDQVRSHASEEKKWILVNIQDSTEFSSQMLNRDVWSDEMCQQIVRSNFYLWQRGITSKAGKGYADMYKLTSFPHISIVDPRTGAAVFNHSVYIESPDFITSLVAFLDCNSLDSNKAPSKITVEGSPGIARKQYNSGESSRSGDYNYSDDEVDDKVVEKEDKEESAMDHNKDKVENDHTKEVIVDYGPIPAEPAAEESDSCRIQIKLPDGTAVVRRYLKSNTIKALHAVAKGSIEDSALQFEMVITYPSKNLSDSLDMTLDEAGLAGAQVLVRCL